MIVLPRSSVDLPNAQLERTAKRRRYLVSCKCGYHAAFDGSLVTVKVDADTAAVLGKAFEFDRWRNVILGDGKPRRSWGAYLTDEHAIPVSNGTGMCGCGRSIRFHTVKARYRPDVKCGGICRNAKGPNCDCSCNGVNHGQGSMIR